MLHRHLLLIRYNNQTQLIDNLTQITHNKTAEKGVGSTRPGLDLNPVITRIKAMNHTTTRPQWVARAATIALWGVGSAYLTINDKTGDPVVYYSAPVVWAVVISLPILATYARYDRQWIASALLWVAALAGCAYTLQMTIGRQAESRDVRVSQAGEVDNARHRITLDLDAAKGMLNQARARCGTGKVCHDSTRATIAIYEGAVAGHEARLAKLSTSAPDAGEKRIARLIQLMFGVDLAELVSIVTTIMFGLVLELATFSTAMFGWHPGRRSRPETLAQPLPPGKRSPLPANVVAFRPKHPVIDALERAGRPVNNSELASLMAVCQPESSKRRREVASQIREWRDGKHVMVALA